MSKYEPNAVSGVGQSQPTNNNGSLELPAMCPECGSALDERYYGPDDRHETHECVGCDWSKTVTRPIPGELQ